MALAKDPVSTLRHGHHVGWVERSETHHSFPLTESIKLNFSTCRPIGRINTQPDKSAK